MTKKQTDRYWRIQWEIAIADDAERKLLAEQNALRPKRRA